VAQPTTVLESGTELAGFRIESFIGQGEIGTVYRATHVRIGREVALKLLSAGRSDDPEFKERLGIQDRAEPTAAPPRRSDAEGAAAGRTSTR